LGPVTVRMVRLTLVSVSLSTDRFTGSFLAIKSFGFRHFMHMGVIVMGMVLLRCRSRICFCPVGMAMIIAAMVTGGDQQDQTQPKMVVSFYHCRCPVKSCNSM